MHISHVKPSVSSAFTPLDGWRGRAPEQPRRGGPESSGITLWQIAVYLAVACAACAAAIVLNDAGVAVPVLPLGAIP